MGGGKIQVLPKGEVATNASSETTDLIVENLNGLWNSPMKPQPVVQLTTHGSPPRLPTNAHRLAVSITYLKGIYEAEAE